jgi:hypothetical protein
VWLWVCNHIFSISPFPRLGCGLLGGEEVSIFHRSRVPTNSETIAKCMCMKCPVQIASACSIGKNQKLLQNNQLAPKGLSARATSTLSGAMSMQANPPNQTAQVPRAEDLPGVYCSTGQARCNDLDMHKTCICPSCQVYKDYNLASAKPTEHYCFNDKAQ